MRLFNALSQWMENKYEKRIEKMRNEGVCPECYGIGYHAVEIMYSSPYDNYRCPGCGGSGTFADWEANKLT